MISKFPQLSASHFDSTMLVSGTVPFAKHNVVCRTSGVQTGFLTEHTLFLIRKGKKNFHFSNGIVTVGSGELLLLKRGVYTISEQLSEDGCFEALILFMPEKLLSTWPCAAFMPPHGPSEHFVVAGKNKLIEGFEQTYLELFNLPSSILDKLLPLKLQEIFWLLSASREGAVIASFLASCRQRESYDIEFIVRKHLLSPLSVPDYAKLCCRSITSFKRDFEALFGTSPKRWINKERLLHAQKLLKSSRHSVAAVAFECGFESTSGFIKHYKSTFGKTPNTGRY